MARYILAEGSIDDLVSAIGTSPTKTASWKNIFFRGCALCITGGSGILSGHLGCLVAPTVTSLISGATAAGHNPFYMIATALAFNSATLASWWTWRGRKASVPIQAATVALALAGTALTTVLNIQDHRHEHIRELHQWFAKQPPEFKQYVGENAKALHIPIDEILESFCKAGVPQRSMNVTQALDLNRK